MKDFPYSIFLPVCSVGHRLPRLFPFSRNLPPAAAAFTTLLSSLPARPVVPFPVSPLHRFR